MKGIFHWRDALAYFGNELDVHRADLQRAGQATCGLLACRSTPAGDARLTNRQGEHAERRLLQSRLWTEELPAALDAWMPGQPPLVVMLAINRSPCADCAAILASALHHLHDRFSLRFEQQVFILASLGYYQGAGFMSTEGAPQHLGRPSLTVSTDRGLQALHEAGWRQCVLDFGPGLTRRGAELREYLQRLH